MRNSELLFTGIICLIFSHLHFFSSFHFYYSIDDNVLPGVVYGVDSDRNILKILVKIDKEAVKTELRTNGKSFENTIYELSVEGENKSAPPLKFNVVPRNTQFCACKLFVIHILFISQFNKFFYLQ